MTALLILRILFTATVVQSVSNPNSESEAGKSKCKLYSGPKPSWDSLSECTRLFDLDDDFCVNHYEFEYLWKNLIRNDNDPPEKFYAIAENQMKMLFDIFDSDGNGYIDIEECRFCWDSWIQKIRYPVSALIVVDVQNDFISGSQSAANSSEYNADDIILPINKLIDTMHFNYSVYSQEWHPKNHISFIENVFQRKFHSSSKIKDPKTVKEGDVVVFEGPPPTEQALWTKHCVKNTFGAELHKNLKIAAGSIIIYKGTDSEVASYSAFIDNNRVSQTKLNTELKARGVTDVYVGGLVYEVCVGDTALDANQLGYKTIVIEDATRGVSSEDVAKFKKKFKEQGGIIVQSNQVDAMVLGIDRRPELAIKLALDIQEKRMNKINNTVMNDKCFYNRRHLHAPRDEIAGAEMLHISGAATLYNFTLFGQNLSVTQAIFSFWLVHKGYYYFN